MFSLDFVARAATACLLAAASADALACSACGCTLNADWATQGLTSRTGLTADLRVDFFNQDDLRSGTGRVDRSKLTLPNDDEIQQHTVNRNATLTLDYGITSDWGVTLSAPWLQRRHTTIAEGDTDISSSRSNSLGDVRVLARYTGFSDAQDWGVQLGLKLPTGDSHRVDFDSGPQQGQMLDRGLQPGTGSTDLLVGAFKFGAIGETADWFGQALLQLPVAADRAFKPGVGANLTAGVRLPRLRRHRAAAAVQFAHRAPRDGQRGRHAQLRRHARVFQPRRDVQRERQNQRLPVRPGAGVPARHRRPARAEVEPVGGRARGVLSAAAPSGPESGARRCGADQPGPRPMHHAPTLVTAAGGPTLSRIVAGAWRMGDWNFGVDERVRWIEGCLDLGITTFDHADIYGNYALRGLVRRGARGRAALARPHADRHQVQHPHGLVRAARASPRPLRHLGRARRAFGRQLAGQRCAPTASTCC